MLQKIQIITKNVSDKITTIKQGDIKNIVGRPELSSFSQAYTAYPGREGDHGPLYAFQKRRFR